jgi:serine/threonine-protein kinase
MEDPEPLENVARTVPAAFAAVVRKLMSKQPEERYQDCGELRNDLLRWTDPARVRAILGAEADAARSFRPPPPELVEDDLRLLDSDDHASGDGLSLRDLGGAEPSMAPRHQAPMPPLPAIIRPSPSRDSGLADGRPPGPDDSRWLLQFAILAALAGLVAILFIAIFLRF